MSRSSAKLLFSLIRLVTLGPSYRCVCLSVCLSVLTSILLMARGRERSAGRRSCPSIVVFFLAALAVLPPAGSTDGGGLFAQEYCGASMAVYVSWTTQGVVTPCCSHEGSVSFLHRRIYGRICGLDDALCKSRLCCACRSFSTPGSRRF